MADDPVIYSQVRFDPGECSIEEWREVVSDAIDIMGNPQYATDDGDGFSQASDLIRFELTGTFTSQEAPARVLDSDATAFSPTQVITVYDPYNSYGAATGNEKGFAKALPLPGGGFRNDIIAIPALVGEPDAQDIINLIPGLASGDSYTPDPYDSSTDIPVSIYADTGNPGDGTPGNGGLTTYVDYTAIWTKLAENRIRKVIIRKGDSGQSAGDPVESQVGRYFDAELSDGTAIWVLACDNKRIVDRLWLPALGEFEGTYAGTYDPGSDSRDLYSIDGPVAEQKFGLLTDDVESADLTVSPKLLGKTLTAATPYKHPETPASDTELADDGGDRDIWNPYRFKIARGEVLGFSEWEGRQVVSTVERYMMIAQISAQVAGRANGSAIFGSGTANLGYLNSSGSFVSLMSGETIYNRCEDPVEVPAADSYIYELVEKIGGNWVLVSNVQLQSLNGYVKANTQMVGHCGAGANEWKTHDPLVDIRYDSLNIQVQTVCDATWTTKITASECP